MITSYSKFFHSRYGLSVIHFFDCRHFAKHPCLYDACQYIMNCLHAEVVRHSGSGMDAPMLPPPPPPGILTSFVIVLGNKVLHFRRQRWRPFRKRRGRGRRIGSCGTRKCAQWSRWRPANYSTAVGGRLGYGE